MKFDMEMSHIIFNPDSSDEEKKAARQAFEEYMKGMKQHERGKSRQEVAEAFTKLIHPERVKKLEEQIAGLQTIKSEDKFRAEVILLLADAFQGGLMWGMDLNKEALEKGVNVMDLIGLGKKYDVKLTEPGAEPAKPKEPIVINPPSDAKTSE